MTESVSKSRINGVELEALQRSVRALERQRAVAPFRFRVHTRWLDGGRTRSTAKNFYDASARRHTRTTPFVSRTDIPIRFGGTDTAMDPLELMLAAVASCLASSLVWCASCAGVHLDAVEARTEGDIDLGGRLGLGGAPCPGLGDIAIALTVESDAGDDEIARLVRRAQRRSPILATLARPPRVSVHRNEGPR